MNLKFDLEKTQTVEFAIGRSGLSDASLVAVPADSSVQQALAEMATATWRQITIESDSPVLYEPSEKYGGMEPVVMPANDELATAIRAIHSAINLPVDGTILDKPEDLYCYMGRFVDADGQRLTGIRRAGSFKGVLKKQLVSLVDDTLRIVPDSIFKLDSDFDMLVDERNIYALRPAALEAVGQLQSAILEAVKGNLDKLAKKLSFLDVESIREYTGRHPRAARMLSSIVSQGFAHGVDSTALRRACRNNGVAISGKGVLRIEPGHEMGFLEILDRRRYGVSLVPKSDELYRAGSRHRV